jgi:tRNA-splicing ligase RtcB
MPDTLVVYADTSSALQRALSRDGRVQFGTLGRGNHFLELQEAEGSVWLTVHSGLRALGQTLRSP